MKNKIILITLIIIALCLPNFAHADGSVTMSTLCNLTYAQQGDEVRINIIAHNNTDNMITICSYSVNNTWHPMEPIDVRPGGDLDIGHYLNVDFLGGDYAVINGLGILYDIGYDNGNHTLYGDDVVVNRDYSVVGNPPVDTSLYFDVYADETNIEAGTWVNYTISCQNNGNTDYSRLTVFTTNQNIETFDLAVGETKILYYSDQYFNDMIESFGYSFIYYDGSAWPTILQENAYMVDITVKPANTQSPVATSTPKPTSSPKPTSAPSPTNTPAPTNTQNNNSKLNTNLQPQDTPAPPSSGNQHSNTNTSSTAQSADSDANAQTTSSEQSIPVTANTPDKKNTSLQNILYLVLGITIAGMAVVLVILIKKLREK